MVAKNSSDAIEAYIKQLLSKSDRAEIKRSHLAAIFQVVPSQINYVIKTRFPESRGYLVESKRGGGGYIRIVRVRYSEQHQLLKKLSSLLEDIVSHTLFINILQLLVDEAVLSHKEAGLFTATATDAILGQDADCIRTRMLRQLLQCLDQKGRFND